MFEKTRLKLTGWYLLIIMLISFSFSLVIYKVLTNEVERFIRTQQLRIERRLRSDFFSPPPLPADPDLVNETKNRILIMLIEINSIIFIVSGGLGYFLAGRTLRPIKEMVDEQNQFITDASHELRTPLTSLRSEIEVNLRDKNLNLNNVKKLLKSNLEEVINLQSLSDNLMELAQYQKKNGDLIFEEISIRTITEIACKKITPLATNKNIDIDNKIKDYQLKGNKQSLVELFIILLDNAVKYSRNNKYVLLTSEKKDHIVIISIKDEGIGIDKKDLPFIFNRFYRSDSSRSKEMAKGYGLGLSIAKKIVNLHNGKITVSSKLGKGTTFIVSLPQG